MSASDTVGGAAAMPQIVLASGSRYRHALLRRLLPDFRVVPPEVDESAQIGEAAAFLAARLAAAKARQVASAWPDALVIGSDQVAECGGRILGKPGSKAAAHHQLQHCAGRALSLYTAVMLWTADGSQREHVDHSVLHFRSLSELQIERYIERDQPLDCAGAFKFESLGVALFEKVETQDPTAIQGLPLLWLSAALASCGVAVL